MSRKDKARILAEVKNILWDLHRDPPDEVTFESYLFGDLGIDGDDAVDVFEAIQERFNVNFASIQWNRHFDPEGGLNPFALLIPSWWKWRRKRIPVTVQDLVDAVCAKKWVKPDPEDDLPNNGLQATPKGAPETDVRPRGCQGRSMWRMFSNAVRALFDPEMRKTCHTARAVFQREYPTLVYEGTSVRAREQDRFVVAVFYRDPGIRTKPCPYKIFRVSSDMEHAMENAEELDCNPESLYWIHGRR
jgi:acyl carrier protein